MILYHDLRVFTIYKAELTHSRAEKTVYARTPVEWELLGDLCLRLHQWDDARECWQSYVESRFNVRVWAKLLRLYVGNDQIELRPSAVLVAASHVLNVNDRFKSADLIQVNSLVTEGVMKVVRLWGADKVKSTVKSINLHERSEQCLLKVIEFCERWK
jgi:hypothetical protein